jgi:hypothetical protein
MRKLELVTAFMSNYSMIIGGKTAGIFPVGRYNPAAQNPGN